MTMERPQQARRHLSLAITGHRHNNAALQANLEQVEAVLAQLCDTVVTILAETGADLGPVRLYNLLAEGVDHITAQLALDRDWQLVAPLPFGKRLNTAINVQPLTPGQAQQLLDGEDLADAALMERVSRLRGLMDQARCFELAERDDEVARIYLKWLQNPTDVRLVREFEAQCNDRVALAGKVMIERADLVVAVWDGKVSNFIGGTGHTAHAALCSGTPVLLVDPAEPENWRVLTRPEEIGCQPEHAPEKLENLIIRAIGTATNTADTPLDKESWHQRSSRMWTLYRGLERVFGKDRKESGQLVARYERPDEIAEGSAAQMVAAAKGLPGSDSEQVNRIVSTILPQFAWSDGISSWLSDAYRSGMCLNFILAACAVIIGAAYLPLGLADQKWIFAFVELLLLVSIVSITLIGKRAGWHARWFETRRVAEYLRHGPIMLLLGVFRPTGTWPGAEENEWPEQYARHTLRSAGIPRLALDRAYLRGVLEKLLLPHVEAQRDYHRGKARRLRNVDHGLDSIAERLFALAILSVSVYLLLKSGAALGLLPYAWPTSVSLWLTFFGIAFPTLGASIAGIRFFADFERFAAISQVSADKLDAVADRIGLLLQSGDHMITYGPARDLAHAVDAIVLEELENWQSVFSAKHISLPA